MVDNILPVRVRKPDSKCCCGCSLSSAAIVAVAICKVQCIIGIFLNVMLCLLYDGQPTFLEDYVNLSSLSDIDAVFGLTIASIVLLSIWLLLAGLVYRGNSSLNRNFMTPWFLFTYLITHFDIGVTVYFTAKFQACYYMNEEFWVKDSPTDTLTYLALMIIFSRGVVVWILNIYLAHVVNRRGAQIEYNNSMLALYILSQMSTNRQGQAEAARANPPNVRKCTCHPNYLPEYLLENSQDNFESSWSLNIEALQGITAFQNPLYPRIDQNSVSEFRDPRCPFAGYGAAPTYEQSFRHNGSNGGVFPN